jgi:DUF971 family protein
MQIKSIKQTSKEILTFTWSDEHVSSFNTNYLREYCPCAGCKGETVLFQTYIPEKKEPLPGHSDVKSILPVGNYAIKITWGDGHDSGLYTFDYLRKLCMCTDCKKNEF